MIEIHLTARKARHQGIKTELLNLRTEDGNLVSCTNFHAGESVIIIQRTALGPLLKDSISKKKGRFEHGILALSVLSDATIVIG